MNDELFEEVFYESNVKPLFEQILREMADDVSPVDLATIIKNTFAECWHIELNEKFTINITKIAINEASKPNGLSLLTSEHQKILLNNQTDEERNNALQDIKAFVDSVIGSCQKYAKNKNIKGQAHQKFANYFSEQNKVTQLYTALARKIAESFSLFISGDKWKSTGYVPFG
jgi:hypothetical protein